MMTEHQKETAFLRQCILYDEGVGRQDLEKKIVQLQRDEGCLRRAGLLMTVLSAMAFAGLGYSAVLLDDFPERMSEFVTRFIVKGCFALGFGSLICLLTFTSLGIVYRRKLDQRREECRQLVRRLLESRLGKPVFAPSQDMRDNRVGERDGRTVHAAAEARSMILL